MIKSKKDKGQQKQLSPLQIQKRKKLVIFPLMFAGFALAMYFIFMPSGDKKEEVQSGLNAELPIPTTEIIDDKRTAYELELFRERRNKRVLSLEDYGIEADTIKSELIVQSIKNQKRQQPESSIQSSASAYKRMNSTLHNFYEQPQENPREKELEQKIEQLQSQLESKTSESTVDMDQQLKLMEESYKMAAKYMPSAQPKAEPAQPAQLPASYGRGETAIMVYKRDKSRVSSALAQTVSDSSFIRRHSRPVNLSFHTVGKNNLQHINKNTIKVCIHGEQVVTTGQNVSLRLLEDIQVGTIVIPRHETITGVAGIQGDRLMVEISSIEYSGQIMPVEIQVYDMDGQPGVFIPGSLERNAVKTILANLGQQSTQANISVNQQSAGEQLAVDLGRNVMQGTGQYISQKIRTVRVRLKAGHMLMLLPNQE